MSHAPRNRPLLPLLLRLAKRALIAAFAIEASVVSAIVASGANIHGHEV